MFAQVCFSGTLSQLLSILSWLILAETTDPPTEQVQVSK